MSRKTKERSPSPRAESEDPQQADETLTQPPSEINPYEVLSLAKDATADQIKSGYRKAALKHHPDKAAPEDKETANKKFQEIALAYAILSDEKRRKRYDATGSTAETLQDDDDFDWLEFFREQTASMVDGSMIDKIKKDYQGSEEEKDDLLQSYQENEGDMDGVYEQIMCSNVLDDDERFRKIIDKAIKAGEVEAYPKYATETKAKRDRRKKRAKAEEVEAMELADELGVKDKLFGDGARGSKKGKKDDSEDTLRALIQQRQKGRAENFLDNLEAKYGGGGKSGKRKNDEPPDEMFQKNAKKSKSKAR